MPESPQLTERRLQQAYLAVHGEEGKRTSDQALVMRDMESFCHAYRPSPEAVTGGELPECNSHV